MESGAELLALQDIDTVRVTKKIPEEKKQRNNWRTENNCPSTKEYLVNSWYPAIRGQWYEASLELRFYPVPKQIVFIFL